MNSLKTLRQLDQNIFAKKSNTFFFYSNRYLHCIRPDCENIFQIVYVISEKIVKKILQTYCCSTELVAVYNFSEIESTFPTPP